MTKIWVGESDHDPNREQSGWVDEKTGRKGNPDWVRGQKMPQTKQHFQMMGDMYEQGMKKMDKENSALRSKINTLQQRLDKANKNVLKYIRQLEEESVSTGKEWDDLDRRL